MPKNLESLLPTLPAPENKPRSQTVARAAAPHQAGLDDRFFTRRTGTETGTWTETLDQQLAELGAAFEPKIQEVSDTPTSHTVDNNPEDMLQMFDIPQLPQQPMPPKDPQDQKALEKYHQDMKIFEDKMKSYKQAIKILANKIEKQFNNPEYLNSLLEHFNSIDNQYLEPKETLSQEDKNHLKTNCLRLYSLREASNEAIMNKSNMMKQALTPIVDSLKIHTEKIQSFFPNIAKTLANLQQIEALPNIVANLSSKGLITRFVMDKSEGSITHNLLILSGQLKNLDTQGIDTNEIKNHIQNCQNLIADIDRYIQKTDSQISKLWQSLADKSDTNYET